VPARVTGASGEPASDPDPAMAVPDVGGPPPPGRTISEMGNGTWIVVMVAVLLFFAVAWGFYTRRGSAFNQRPFGSERGDGAPGAAGPSRISAGEDETEGVPDTHGTR